MSGELILITGRNRAGKTSLANGIIKNVQKKDNVNVLYIPFAKPLKDDLLSIGFSKEYLDKKTKKARALMRAYGDARREQDSKIFLRKWRDYIKDNIMPDKYNVIVSDDMYLLEEFKEAVELAHDIGLNVNLTLVKRPSLPPLTEKELSFETVLQQQEIEREVEDEYISNKKNVSRCKRLGILPAGLEFLGVTLPLDVRIRVVVNDYPSVEEFVYMHS